MMTAVPRAEVMEVRSHTALSTLCHQVKNLYNRALFLYKQAQQQGTYLSYYQLDKQLKNEDNYKTLPAHTTQHTLKLLIRNWRVFYQARKAWQNTLGAFLDAY